MKYKCNECKYTTVNKSNYNKHLKSKKHLKNDTANLEKSQKQCVYLETKTVLSRKFKEHACTNCGKKYETRSGLYKHNKGNCEEGEEFYKQTLELKQKLEEKTKELDIFKNERIKHLEQVVENYSKSSKNAKSITYNISVKNYVQQYYDNAPALLPMKNYEVLEFIDKRETLMDKLIFHYNHDTLCMFLGDFLVQYYKKDNPSQQSLWNSDAARLTYVIKQYIAKNKSLWIDDIKGAKTIKYMITPMLDYINNYVKDCIKEESDKVIDLSQEDGNIINKNLEILSEITTIINDHLLHDDIIKYIAAYFRMENNTIDV